MSDSKDRLYIRVLKDGNKPKFEMMFKGEKLADVSYTDIVEIIMQFTSSLRWR